MAKTPDKSPSEGQPGSTSPGGETGSTSPGGTSTPSKYGSDPRNLTPTTGLPQSAMGGRRRATSPVDTTPAPPVHPVTPKPIPKPDPLGPISILPSGRNRGAGDNHAR